MRPFLHRAVLVLAVAFLLGGMAPADELEPCQGHECSNDFVETGSAEPAVFGDELFSWNRSGWKRKRCSTIREVPCTTDSNRRCYEIATYPERKVVRRTCEKTRWSDELHRWAYEPPIGYFSPYAVYSEDFPRFGVDSGYIVRACVGPNCSDWSPRGPEGEQLTIDFQGGEYACFGSNENGRCEERCYPSARKMFPEIPDC